MGDGRPVSSRLGLRWMALLALLLALCWWPALDPSQRLVPRDAVNFNIPLLATYAKYFREDAIPLWNPDLSGGHPVVSNPNYAALYPPTWAAAYFEPARAFSLLVVLHLAGAAWGALWALKPLGLQASSRALAALAFGGGAWLIGLLFAARILFGIAWLPWVFGAALRLHAPASRAAEALATGRLALCLAALIYAGEPVSVLIGGAVALLGVSWHGELSLRSAARAVLALSSGALLAAPSLLPALARLTDSVRFEGLAEQSALLWSLNPNRIVELFLPRFIGDPGRFEEGFFYGWKFHDRAFPYVLVLTPGSLLVFVGLSALLRGPARPGLWALRAGSLAGIFLALGRYNPAMAWTWLHLPILKSIRYPEKFILLTIFCLLMAGVLEWNRLLEARQRGPIRGADFPLVMALLVALLGLSVWVGLSYAPGLAEELVGLWTPLPADSPDLVRSARFLHHLYGRTTIHGLVLVLLLSSLRLERFRSGALGVAALVLLAAEQVDLGRNLFRPIPRQDFARPSPLLEACRLQPGDRIWTDVELSGETAYFLPGFRRVAEMAQTQLERLDPATGVYSGLRYVLHKDYDLTHTRSARRALALFERSLATGRGDPRPTRLLEAWGVACAIRARLGPEISREVAANPSSRPQLAVGRRLEHRLPEARFVPQAAWHPDAAAAEAALLSEGVPLATREHLIGVGPATPLGFDSEARVEAYRPHGRGATVRYRARLPALLVVAQTYDPNFRATVNDQELTIYETAAGMIAVLVPPGVEELELTYRDPWLTWGLGFALLGLSLVALLGAPPLRSADRGL